MSAGSEPSRHVILRNLDGRIVEVAPDQAILAAAEAAGVALPFGCRQGGCTTCAARLVEGELDQTDAVALTDAMRDRGWVLICVGRPLTDRVVLDVSGPGTVHRRRRGSRPARRRDTA